MARFEPRRRQQIYLVGLAILTIVYPLIFRTLETTFPFIPWPGTAVLITCATFGILALGLNIVMGFAGLLDLGYVAFYAIGAYTTAFLASDHFGVHISWWIVVFIAVWAAAIFGILLGAPTLKLRGDYLAIVTLGFGEIVRIVFRNLGDFTFALPAILGGAILVGPHANLTGGNVGINPIDPPIIPIPGPWGEQIIFSNQNAIASFYLVVALLTLTFVICARLRDPSPVAPDGHPRRRDGRGSDGHRHRHRQAAGLSRARASGFAGRSPRLSDGDSRELHQRLILVVVIIILAGSARPSVSSAPSSCNTSTRRCCGSWARTSSTTRSTPSAMRPGSSCCPTSAWRPTTT
jgi:hypothetical protein